MRPNGIAAGSIGVSAERHLCRGEAGKEETSALRPNGIAAGVRLGGHRHCGRTALQPVESAALRPCTPRGREREREGRDHGNASRRH